MVLSPLCWNAHCSILLAPGTMERTHPALSSMYSSQQSYTTGSSNQTTPMQQVCLSGGMFRQFNLLHHSALPFKVEGLAFRHQCVGRLSSRNETRCERHPQEIHWLYHHKVLPPPKTGGALVALVHNTISSSFKCICPVILPNDDRAEILAIKADF